MEIEQPRHAQAVQPKPLVISKEMLAAPDESSARIDFERGMSHFPGLILAIILLNALAFAWEIATRVVGGNEAMIDAGTLVRKEVLAGQVWRLLTATFLHADFGHLAGNCVILYIVGLACEHAYGPMRTAVIYFFSGLSGWLLSMAFLPGPSLGASGAIFGVTGCVVAFFHRYRRQVLLRDKRIGFVLLIWAAYSVGTAIFNPWIDNFAHIGGLAGGALMSLLLRPRLLPGPSALSGEASNAVFW